MSPHVDRLGVTVDALAAVVEEFAVAQRVFEGARVDGVKSRHAAVQHVQSVHRQCRFSLHDNTAPAAFSGVVSGQVGP